jgi:hypothetical protein
LTKKNYRTGPDKISLGGEKSTFLGVLPGRKYFFERVKMSKRYTDSRKWGKGWLIEMPNEYKLLWFYILDSCSIAGVWDVSFIIPNAIFKCEFTEAEALKYLSKQITVLGERKWLVNDFIVFQYKKLKPESPPHRAVISELENLGLWEPGENSIPLPDGAAPIPVDEKKPLKPDKKVKMGSEGGNVSLSDTEISKLWEKFGQPKTAECIEFLSLYKAEKQYKTKSDYLTILRWVASAVDERKRRNPGGKVLQKGCETDEILDIWHGEGAVNAGRKQD